MTQYGAGVECESENVLFLSSLGCVSFKGPSMNPGSVPPSQVWSRLQYVPVREMGVGRESERLCVCVRVCRLGERATCGGGMAMTVQMNGLCRAAMMQKVVVWFFLSLAVVCSSLSEVRSGRFEGRGLGVLSRLETGRRGNGRSGRRMGERQTDRLTDRQWVQDHKTLFVYCWGWAGDRTVSACVQLPCCCRCQIEPMDDDQSRETRSVQLAATCLASWMVNGESDRGELEEKGEFLPFIPCLSLVLPCLPCLVLASIWSGQEQGGGVEAALCSLRIRTQCNLHYGWTVYRREAATVRCRGEGGRVAGVAALLLWWQHTAAGGWARGHGGSSRRGRKA